MSRAKSGSNKNAAVVAFPAGRGQVWWTDLGEPIGHEQGFDRPFLILSIDMLNDGPSGLIIGAPITSKDHEQPWHIRAEPPEAQLTEISFIQPECIRSISKDRLKKPRGYVTSETLAKVEDMVRILLGL